jgi:hypothetical protein
MDQFDRAINRILSEVFLDTEYSRDPKTNRAERVKLTFSDDSKKKSTNIGSINGFSLYRKDTKFPNGTSVTIYGLTDDVKIVIKGDLLGSNTIRVKSLEAGENNALKVDELYHYLIDQLGYTIISDTVQSIGGKMVWKKLFRYPDIKISYSIKGSNKWKELPVDKRQHYEVLWTSDESSARGDLILKAENANKS